MKKKTKRIVWVAIPVLAVVAAGAFFLLRKKDDGRLEVEVAPAERQEIVQTVSAIGRIQPVIQVNITSDVSAKIIKLPVAEGDWVEKGQLLAQLDRERYVAEVESAEASLRSAQASARLSQENLVKTQKDYERTRELHGKDLESQSSLDAAFAAQEVERARHRAALDGIAQAQAALKQARDALSKTTIYSPMAGTVSKLNKELGEIALGSQFQSDVIMVISNLQGMEALVDVDENDVVQLSLGDKATIEVDALPDHTFEGEVTEIANSANVSAAGTTDQKTEFEVKVAIKDPSGDLRPGMTANADIVTDVRDERPGGPDPERLGAHPAAARRRRRWRAPGAERGRRRPRSVRGPRPPAGQGRLRPGGVGGRGRPRRRPPGQDRDPERQPHRGARRHRAGAGRGGGELPRHLEGPDAGRRRQGGAEEGRGRPGRRRRPGARTAGVRGRGSRP